MFRAYLGALIARKAKELEVDVKIAALPWGGLSVEKKDTEEGATNKIFGDQLSEFPDDVKHLSPKEVNELVHHSTKLPSGHPGKWSGIRKEAALGDDTTAKRAAQNDFLWRKYCDLRNRGVNVTLELLKYIVQVDVTRSFLYPNITQLTDRHLKERAAGDSLTVVDPEKPPPRWHVESLSKEGVLSHWVGKLDSLVHYGK